MKRSTRLQVAGALSCIGLVGIFVIWQVSRRPLEAAPVSPPPTITEKAVNEPSSQVPRKPVTQPVSTHSRAGATVPLRITVVPKAGASLTVWVDDQRVLHKQLDAAAKKKFGLFGHGASEEAESVYVTPGEHKVRVNVQADGNDESRSLKGTFPEGSSRTLTVTFNNDNEMRVRLK